jgi:hypothetical protein
MKYLLLFFTVTLSLTLNAQTKQVQLPAVAKPTSTKTQKNANYTYTIISAPNKTWGYDILMEKRLFIHQTSVPGLPGNEGFKTMTNAEKVAKLVIEKLKKGEMPPTVTIDEMKKFRVL